jgi:elongation factor 3
MVVIDAPQQSLKLLREALNEETPSSPTEDESIEVLSYVASLASTLAKTQDFTSETWVDALSPYMSSLDTTKYGTVTDNIEKYRTLTEKATFAAEEEDDDSDDETGGEELCNIRFSLAYGGKILLHQTKLKLRRGNRYALVGQNGAGKTTLMTAINNGKLEGWPFHLRTEYVDSGSNVDPVHEAKHVLVDLMESTKKDEQACKAMLDQLKFTQIMMDGTIGELSGGWQMKLRLAKAVLIDADILLLDEPTNHLDHKTVDWLTNYLNGLTQTTVICVSHDTPFLEKITTGVIHYEQRAAWGPHRRLVHYR